jgi:peptide/nickel transport system permease protein
MLRFFTRRALLAVLTLFAVSVTTFLLFFAAPADPAALMCGSRVCSADQAARIRTSLGLDRPLTVQYAEYMKGVFVGRTVGTGSDAIQCPAPCLGVSFRNHLPVLTILGRGFRITIASCSAAP